MKSAVQIDGVPVAAARAPLGPCWLRAALDVLAGAGTPSRARWLLPVLAVFLLAAATASLAVGAMAIPPGRILSILAAQVGLDLPWSFTELEAAVLLQVRAPRVALGALAGGGLALGGVLMQALFRNPLADPGLIGVASGSAMASAALTVAGPLLLPPLLLHSAFTLPLAACVGGWLVAVLVVRLAQRLGHTRVEHLLLAGIAVNALAGAAIGLLMLVANDAQMRELAFWSFGSLGRATWQVLPVLLLAILPGLLLARRLAPSLNALLLGESEAALLGVRVERVKRLAIVLTCFAVGTTVAFTGLIGFVGLVVPHVVRLLAGPDHRRLLPASVLLGAALLLLADLISRTLAAPIELPIGLVTALLGAPFFLALLLRDRRREIA